MATHFADINWFLILDIHRYIYIIILHLAVATAVDFWSISSLWGHYSSTSKYVYNHASPLFLYQSKWIRICLIPNWLKSNSWTQVASSCIVPLCYWTSKEWNKSSFGPCYHLFDSAHFLNFYARASFKWLFFRLKQVMSVYLRASVFLQHVAVESWCYI